MTAKYLVSLALAFLPVIAICGERPGAFKPLPSGDFELGELKFQILHSNADWQSVRQSPESVSPQGGWKEESGELAWSGTFKVTEGVFKVREKVKRLSDAQIAYSAELASDKEMATNFLGLELRLPTSIFNGMAISSESGRLALPAEFTEKHVLMSAGSPSTLKLQCPAGLLEISCEKGYAVEDTRKFTGKHYAVKLPGAPRSGSLGSAKIAIRASYKPYASAPLSLKAAANMGFKDEVANDRQGGWTDQGPENDLRMFKPGKLKLQCVDFDIVAPDENAGKSCIVLGGAERDWLPKSAEVPASGRSFKYLYVLHALAWSPSEKVAIGRISARYEDGSVSTKDVVCKEHVGNWWNPPYLPKAQIAWTDDNKSAPVGLYMTRFELESKALSSLRFDSFGNAVWMIAGLSGSDSDIPAVSEPLCIMPGKEWRPIGLPKDIEAGSALDFSHLVADVPAGKHGWIKVEGGRFVHSGAPGRRLRLYGVNLCCEACFPEKEESERLAARLAASGYNSVRIHHYDNILAGGKDEWSPVEGKGSTTSLDPAAADKLDYLVHCLKMKGLYITTDLFVSRKVKDSEIPDVKELKGYALKGLIPVLDSAMKNWQDFARNLMEHVNPYTGLAWKDDPAIFSISLVNEDTIFDAWKSSPEIKSIYESRFEEWLKRKSLASLDGSRRQRLFTAFLIETYDNAYGRMSSFLRSIGVKASLSDQNMFDNASMAFMRDKYDYVDNHYYWDHPGFPVTLWRLPASFQNRSATANFVKKPNSMCPTRIFGKPFMITEFNTPCPVASRAESGVLAGAIAALQDWDGLYRFDYASSGKPLSQDVASNFFSVATDPINLLSDRIATLLFLRGDVASSEISLPFVMTEKLAEDFEQKFDSYPDIYRSLGLVAKTGTVVLGGSSKMPSNPSMVFGFEPALEARDWNAPFISLAQGDEAAMERIKTSAKLGKGRLDMAGRKAVSSTGELEADKAKGTFTVSTPRSEAAVLDKGGAVELRFMKVDAGQGFATLSASSLDVKPLEESSRILLFHLTDVQNSKAKFRDRNMTMLDSFGELPHLVRRGVAKFTLKPSGAGSWRVWALDLSGKRMRELRTESSGGLVSFQADTFEGDSPSLCYEAVRE